MNFNSVISKIEYSPDLPVSISRCLPELFGDESINEMSNELLKDIRERQHALFSGGGAAEYRNSAKEYALYYLPVNFYKIWRPLLDLAIGNGLKSSCEILELGPGPGSSTFGLIEFYRYLAMDNPMTEFRLKITAVERVKEFFDVFYKLLPDYMAGLPENLKVDITTIVNGAKTYLESNPGLKFDLITESNMLNPNESLKDSHLEELAHLMNCVLKRHGTVILIEPAASSLASHLKTMRKYLISSGMNVFSPCCCSNPDCSQFTSAQLDISGIKILQQLYKSGVITKLQHYHSFEYAVFRNDSLAKYDYSGDGTVLKDLSFRAGEIVSFKAFISAVSNQNEVFSLKLCDGSLGSSEEVWMAIPKSNFLDSDINSLTSGRGGLIDVKNAVIIDKRKIGLTDSTRFKLYL